MPVAIDKEACTRCGQCERECPGDVLRMDPETGYPYNAYIDDCWYCGVCEVECHFGALRMTFPVMVV